jgi:hypothetical protein
VEVARAHGERGNEALALMLLGEAHTSLGSMTAGKANFTRALRLARNLAMVGMIERCQAGVAAIERQASEV